MRDIEELRKIANEMSMSLEILLYKMLSDAMKENEMLKKKITFNEKSRRKMQQSLMEQIETYKSRNEKAIEYIKNHTENIDRGTYYEDYVETYDLLNILEGGDE